MTAAIFVTGTDTGVGKTWFAAALLRQLVAAGYRAVGMKPLVTGAPAGDGPADDVRILRDAGNVDAPLACVNPYAFVPAMAPHVAAARAGTSIDLARIAAAADVLRSMSDCVVVEGAGGVLVPLDDRHDMLDLAARLRLSVVLVVGVRLGCINHALLSALAIRARGLAFAGWIANRIDPAMAEPGASIEALAARLDAPCLADCAWDQGGPLLTPGTLAHLAGPVPMGSPGRHAPPANS